MPQIPAFDWLWEELWTNEAWGRCPGAGPQTHVVRSGSPAQDPRPLLGCSYFPPFFHASSTPNCTWHRPLWQLQGELSAERFRFSGAVTRRRGASMDTGLGKPGAASPEATVHAPQLTMALPGW